MATFTQIGAPPRGASAPVPTDPLAGQIVLDADGQAAGVKGIQVTKRALKRIRIAMAKENITPDQGGERDGFWRGERRVPARPVLNRLGRRAIWILVIHRDAVSDHRLLGPRMNALRESREL